MDYLEHNRDHWNKSTETHWTSDFYRVDDWIAGKYDSLKAPELRALPEDLKGLKILHLQCHFGQDTLSLARRGASVTGVDLSDRAIERAEELSEKSGVPGRFICCDLYSLPDHLDEINSFDIVFTSYGTIGWLPDLDKWAGLIQRYLKPGGLFVFAEFHPVVWMLNNEHTFFEYSYFKGEPIVEESEGSYTDGSKQKTTEVGWNHSIGEVMTALLDRQLKVEHFREYDYSPWNCFHGTVELAPDQFHFKGLEGMLPICYSLTARKPG